VNKLKGGTDKITYLAKLVDDIEALEAMLEAGAISKGPMHIGAEQEFCLVTDNWMPAPVAQEVLKELADPHFTTELAQYNLEINLDPLVLEGACFSALKASMDTLLAKAGEAASRHSARILLTGILPTLSVKYMDRSYMTPVERYKALDQAIREIRQDHIELHIKGVDEINLHHDSILYEGCNTSFQMHLQIDPDDFRDTYNWAQAIAGPVLAVCTNSPLLMGKELWEESRIALFSQSVDTRASSFYLDEREARVGFGNSWVTGSPADFYKDSIIRFRSLLNSDIATLSTEEWKNGKVPKLKALNLHNGTVYRWNRLCYGENSGKPHLRIENRYLSAGPSTTDEIANMMLWVGIMAGRPKALDAIHEKMDFQDAKANFYHAARYGKAAQFYWAGKLYSAQELMLEELLPLAYNGLYKLGINPADVEKFLSVITNRIRGKGGSRWQVENYRSLIKQHKRPDALRILTATIFERQQKDYPVDSWQRPKPDRKLAGHEQPTVGDCMETRIITAQEDDSAELVFKIMQWQKIHHLPILNERGNLTGLLSWSDMAGIMEKTEGMRKRVSQYMVKHLVTTTEDTPLVEAARTMEVHGIHCLPVVDGQKLLGIITTNDL